MFTLALFSTGYAPGVPAPAARAVDLPRRTAALVMQESLEAWLGSKGGISPKFLPAVLATCEDEMIGSVSNLETLAAAGMLGSVFKPVVAASIEAALGGQSAVATASGSGASVMAEAAVMPLREVKRLLMLYGQDTWGSEAGLRARLDMFVQQRGHNAGAHWDAGTMAWIDDAGLVDRSPVTAKVAGFAVPTAPDTFSGAQWAPEVAGLAAPAPKAAPAPAPKAAPAPAPPAPAPAPPPAAAAPSPAPPAADPNKSTFTVTLKTPDGDKSFECDPDMYMLDQVEELDNADDFADLPYACRAGSCSACAGKVVSGTVDTSANAFLNDEQKAAGFILTCCTKPTSDCVITTDMEDDLY